MVSKVSKLVSAVRSLAPLCPIPHRSAPGFKAVGKTASLVLGAAALAGCAGNAPANFGVEPATGGAAIRYTGSVYGGQQPVAGATIQLMTVGTTGLGSGSTNILTGTTTTDANGNFALTGKYTCGSASQVYLLATGGNPGSGTNSNIGLAAALGSCSTLLANAATTFISVNEVTTVAAAFALAPFATSGKAIGATGVNPTGLVNAFANAASLANASNGTAGGTNVPAGATVPTAEINTLADILASCVNSTSSASVGCSPLFAATGAGDTFSAAIAIARNPGANAITALYSQAGSTSPFQPTLSTQPKDFSVAITYTAGGMFATPYGISIDAAGDAFVTNESASGSNTVVKLSPTGVSQAISIPGGYGPQGVAVDPSGNVWVAVTASNEVAKIVFGGGNGYYILGYAGSLFNGPTGIAVDSAGKVFTTNFNGNSVTGLAASGAQMNGSPFTGIGNIVNPSAIAVGPAGNVYVTSGNGSAVKLSNAGAYVGAYTDSALQGPVAVALDPAADLFLTGFTTGSAVAGGISEFNSTGTPALAAPVATGIASPAGAASDGTSVWVANSTASGSLARLTYGSAAASSPASGFGSLNTPIGVAIDGTGSVWTTNSGSNTVSKFIGIAAPVTTPLAANNTFVGP